MKTTIGSIAAAISLAVGAFADLTVPSNTLDSFPVGNEQFFRAEGAALVRGIFLTYAVNDNVDATPLSNNIHQADTYSGWSTITTSQNGTSHNINLDGSWTEARLFEQAKKGLTTFLSSIKRTANVRYAIQVDWGGKADEALGSATFFRKMINFTLEKGNDGSWHAPAGVTETLAMNFADNVFVRASGVVNARLRWWNGEKFNDSNPYSNISLTSLGKKSSFVPGPYAVFVDFEKGVIALPAEPILKKFLGILTLELTGETIVRYSTSTGTMLLGKQERQEPALLVVEHIPATQWTGPAVGLAASVGEEETGTLKFEISDELQTWREIPEEDTFPFYRTGAIGKGVWLTQAEGFFRVQHR